MQVAPRSVLVTGANRGLGLEIVRQFIGLPTPPKHVFAVCRNPSNADELKKLTNGNAAVKILPLDLNDLEGLDSLQSTVSSVVGDEGLNLLINNAGMNLKVSLEDVTAAMMLQTFQVNTVAPLMITKAFLPLLKQGASAGEGVGMNYRRAMVVNYSSIYASLTHNSAKDRYDYCTSKCALNMVVRRLAKDITKDGILVISFNPGWTQTDMGSPSATFTTQESVENLLKVIPGVGEKETGLFLDNDGEKIEW